MFDPEVLEAVRRDALARYPAESCGTITSAGYQAWPNLHEDPEQHFRMSAEVDEMVAAGAVLALVHSHPITRPGEPDWPSVDDQRQQIAQGIPWGLCVVQGPDRAELPYFWGDGIPDVPLMPRDFRWGPPGTDGRGDCYGLLRDWYRLHRGLVLDEAPRGPTWLEDGPNLYLVGAERHGFTHVLRQDLQPGDTILCAMASQGRPNHAAIYLGDGMVLHHTQNRKAQRCGYEAISRAAVMFLRPPAGSAP